MSKRSLSAIFGSDYSESEDGLDTKSAKTSESAKTKRSTRSKPKPKPAPERTGKDKTPP